MSTYYALTCPKCKESSGFSFSRQAWGWGNADIIETFKFLMAHAECGDNYKTDLQIVSEHSDLYGPSEFFGPPDWKRANFSDKKYQGRFPHDTRYKNEDEWHQKYLEYRKEAGYET